MRTTLAVIAAALLLAGAGRAVAQRPTTSIQVYKSATCGCCGIWVERLRAEGFDVRVNDTEQLDAVKASYGVPRQAQSCHTAVVSGYVLEGHVPMADVHRLLKERPAITGIAVPGMPIGSPGMEVAGMKPQPFNVLAFDKTGQTRVYSSHNQ